jgi:hypothetical protein
MDPFHEGLAAAFPQIRQFLSRQLDPVELEGTGPARPVLAAYHALGDWPEQSRSRGHPGCASGCLRPGSGRTSSQDVDHQDSHCEPAGGGPTSWGATRVSGIASLSHDVPRALTSASC